jgi:hypothetical protein
VTGTSTLDPNLSIEIALSDFTGTVFSNTLLPLSQPNPGNFTVANFALFGGSVDNPIEAEGTLNPSTATPEPTNLAPTVTGISLLAVWFRRRLASRS